MGSSRKIMESSELKLFNKIFGEYDFGDWHVYNQKNFTFHDWIILLQTHKLYFIYECDPLMFNPQYNWVHANASKYLNHSYFKYMCSTDLEYIKAYNIKPIQWKLDRIILCCLDLLENDVFSPPILLYGSIHPGKNLISACQMLKKKVPLLVLVHNDTKISKKYKCKRISSIKDLVEIYGQDARGCFMNANHLTNPDLGIQQNCDIFDNVYQTQFGIQISCIKKESGYRKWQTDHWPAPPKKPLFYFWETLEEETKSIKGEEVPVVISSNYIPKPDSAKGSWYATAADECEYLINLPKGDDEKYNLLKHVLSKTNHKINNLGI